jgi:hypothetical protein
MKISLLKDLLAKVLERGIAITGFIFPFMEISYYFGSKVFLSVENLTLKIFYLKYIAKLSSFYEANIYLIFIVMVAIFIICSRGTIALTKFVRFNIIQAILINIICSCIGSIFIYIPIVLRESIIGILLANFVYLGVLFMICYSILLIIYGRYPRIPIISEAARLQVKHKVT